MPIAKTYVLAQNRTDRWGRTRMYFFKRLGPHHFERVSRLTEATHFRDEARAEEVLSLYPYFDAWTPTHVPIALYPDSIADEIRRGFKVQHSGV